MSDGRDLEGPLPGLRWGVVVFPGTNTEIETLYVLSDVLGQQAEAIWHEETSLPDLDVVVLPGGFAHGDYLRAGAVARFSPVMGPVARFAGDGGAVLGICNGFQVLLEAGLLPGAMLRNARQRFISQPVYVRVEDVRTPFLSGCAPGQVLRVPIAHGEGNYTCDPAALALLRDRGQVVLRYCDARGRPADRDNVNGSTDAIAGIRNLEGNVMGLMPHPERAAEPALRMEDGRLLFESAIRALRPRPAGRALDREPACSVS